VVEQPAASTAINIAQPFEPSSLILNVPHMIDTVMPGHGTGSLLRRESSITDVQAEKYSAMTRRPNAGPGTTCNRAWPGCLHT
jgi:hypothetical protein